MHRDPSRRPQATQQDMKLMLQQLYLMSAQGQVVQENGANPGGQA